MKRKSWMLAGLLAAAGVSSSMAQTVNWSAIQPNQRHFVNVNSAWDYSATLGVGYGYRFKTKLPLILNAQFSVPAGQNLTDDFKTGLGLKARVFKAGNFHTAVEAQGIFRRYESDLVQLRNFGSQFTGTAGYYRSKWFVAAEFGFDKAITTHILNSDVMRGNYPGSTDGWYVPTAGNFHYGLQAGYSAKRLDVYLRGGKTVDQNFQPSATVPQYAQLGVNVRF